MFHQTFNAIFISDLHLGYKVTNKEKLFKFIKEVKTKKLFLVGDIIHRQCKIDDYELEEFINLLNAKDCEVIFITGNHELHKKEMPNAIKNINFLNNYIYMGISKRVYIAHGHCYDTKDDFLKFLKYIDKRVQIKNKNSTIKRVIKKQLYKILKFMAKIFLHSSFRKYMVLKAIKNRCNVVICGHFHKKNSAKVYNTEYYNCGDWIENCSFVAENTNGNFKLLKL